MKIVMLGEGNPQAIESMVLIDSFSFFQKGVLEKPLLH